MTFSIVMFLIVIATIFLFRNRLQTLKEQYEEELRKQVTIARKDAKKRSAAVQWGKSIEHFVPFMEDFPVPAEDVNFLGMPIDYVGFTDTNSKTKCAVHFVEVKSGQAGMMTKQRNIRDAIKAGRVHWHEISVEGNTEK